MSPRTREVWQYLLWTALALGAIAFFLVLGYALVLTSLHPR